MRIIGGRFRGKKLEYTSDETTRPTTDRVKENIFNILASRGVDFETASVFVPFCGSGQMGLECISRGTTKVVFNDLDTKVVKKNLGTLGFSSGLVLSGDCFGALDKLKNNKQKFSLVFLDPPYTDSEKLVGVVNYLRLNKMLAEDFIIVCETEKPDIDFGNDFNVDVRRYGRAVIYCLTKSSHV